MSEPNRESVEAAMTAFFGGPTALRGEDEHMRSALTAALPHLLAAKNATIERCMSVLAAKDAEIEALREALEAVKSWAAQRCPCDNDEPRICPLCDADVSKDRCKAVDATFPRRILEKIDAALEMSGGVL